MRTASRRGRPITNDRDHIASAGRALTGVMAAALAKLCDVHELIYLASKIHRTARARTTLEGRYAICEIPTGVELFITVVAADGTRLQQSTFIEPGESVAFLDLSLPAARPSRP